MTYHYCTLFDSFFLSRGLALYDSLKKTTPDFKLYIFPFDERSDKVLRALSLQDVVIVSQNQFETPELLKIKAERTRGEYCWTCTSVIIDYCLRVFKLPHCTYLDADLFFFSNANQLVDEMKEDSVLITDHRYTPRYDHSKTSGKYCVQFMTFKNDENGLETLAWWKDRCLEWCFDRLEDGKFGDQKYLDDWPTRFKGIYDSQNEGAGLAPWNIQQYSVLSKRNGLVGKNRKSLKEWPIIFYHFHGLKFLSDQKIDFGAYLLAKQEIELIYMPYLSCVIAHNEYLKSDHGINFPIQRYATRRRWPVLLHKTVRRLLRVYNIYDLKRNL